MMTAIRINTDRLTITGLAVAAVLPFLALSPVKAATPACTVEAQAIRAEASSADPQAAARALRTVKTAEAICTAGNRHEAAKKFAVAREQLGNVQLAQRQP